MLYESLSFVLIHLHIMAAHAHHIQMLNRQQQLQQYFRNPTPMLNIPNLAAYIPPPQALMAGLQAQFAPLLGPDFLDPHLYPAGTIPVLNDDYSVLVNGFCLDYDKHLVRIDATLANPEPTDHCSCGDWIFYSFGCHHINRIHPYKCSKAQNSYKTAMCPGMQAYAHTAKAIVLGPCAQGDCTWWADRENHISAAGQAAQVQQVQLRWQPL